MELPRALAPWSASLDLFPRDLALALGPLVQRLDLMVKPMDQSHHQGPGEPDGFDGIARRGAYERLLLSEWLLADEAPEEFVRRATRNEHVFLEIARREPVGARSSVVLFDSGPNQWGPARVAHLAALIVLARRAEAAGAQFAWGVLQRPDGPLIGEMTPGSVGGLLEARAPREATGSDLDAWRERLSAAPADDYWIVGGTRLTRLTETTAASLLEITDVCEGDANRLVATLHGAVPCARRESSVVLELPPDRICARLLRDPFSVAAAFPNRVKPPFAPDSNLLFAPGGSKLLARAQERGSLVVYPLPNSPRSQTGKPKRYRIASGTPLLAAGRAAKAIIAVTVTPPIAGQTRNLSLEGLGNTGRNVPYGRYDSLLRENAFSDPAPLLPCFSLPIPGSPTFEVIALLPGGLLMSFQLQNETPVARSLANQVEAVAPLSQGFTYICRMGDKRVAIAKPGVGEQTILEMEPGGTRSFFGFGGTEAHPQLGLLAVECADGEWAIHFARDTTNITAGINGFDLDPKGAEVVGVALWHHASPGRQGTPVLVLIRGDQRAVLLAGAQGVRFALPETSSPIVQAVASPFAPQIAYATEAGEVFMYSLTHQELLYRSVVEDTP
ncbi:MAG: hypothetical protein H7Z41_13945 [Cytophagales bacterium]|nr:hypothetical protein [Armatimonadota bacterium]